MSQRNRKPAPEPPANAPPPEPAAPDKPNIPPGTSFDTEEGRVAQGRDTQFRHTPENPPADEDEQEREHRRERQRDRDAAD